MKQFKKGDSVRAIGNNKFLNPPAPTVINGTLGVVDTPMGNITMVRFNSVLYTMYTTDVELVEEADLTQLDVPFGELDRATQLRLVEHVLDGGKVEVLQCADVFITVTGYFMLNNKNTYRAARNEPVKPRIDVEKLEVKAVSVAKSLDELTKTIREIKQCLSKS